MAALAWIVLVFSILGLAQSACENLLAQDFGFYTDGSTKYSKSHAEKDFPSTKGPYKMVEDGDQGSGLTTVSNGAIKGYFGKGLISAKETGFSWYSMLPKQGTEMSMSYKVKFSEGFDWTKGGKLPGLCGGEGGAGTHCPVGCSAVSKDRGFSTRLMWRSDGRMVTYAYYPDKPKSIRCGEDWNWSQKIQDGVWNHIRTWVKLNTPGEEDGEHKAWLNGEEVLYKTGIRFRYNEDFEISRAYITTYAGGSSREMFAPNQDQEIEFDDFKVWEGDCEDASGSFGGSSGSDAGESSDEGDGDSSSGSSGGGAMGAPTMVNHDYFLYQQEAGWDIDGAGDLDSYTPDSSQSFEAQLTECGEVCDETEDCNIFTYFNGKCYLKENVGATPEFVGATSLGHRWLYIEDDR